MSAGVSAGAVTVSEEQSRERTQALPLALAPVTPRRGLGRGRSAPPGASPCPPGAGRHPLRVTLKRAEGSSCAPGLMGAVAMTPSQGGASSGELPLDGPLCPQQGHSVHAPRAGRAADVGWSKGHRKLPSRGSHGLAVEPGRPSTASVLRLDRQPRAGPKGAGHLAPFTQPSQFERAARRPSAVMGGRCILRRSVEAADGWVMEWEAQRKLRGRACSRGASWA